MHDDGWKSLARCVGEPEAFLTEHWTRRPLLHHGDAADLLSLDDVDRLIAQSALRLPAFRLVRNGQTLPASTYTRRARMGSRDIADLVDVGRVHSLFTDGATVVLQGLHRYHPPVAALCRDLELILCHPVQANAYLTPPVAQGLDVHADAHDVFAVQTHGRKQWVLYPDDGEEPSQDVTLEPGDCLYVPKGTRHAARTVSEASLHLTVGVRLTTWADVLRRAADEALADPALQEPLPPGYAHAPEELSGEVLERLKTLGKAVTDAEPEALAAAAAERFWASRQPDLSGQLSQLLTVDTIGDDTHVARRPRATAVLRENGEHVRLLLGDRELRLPAVCEPALRAVLERERFRVGELADHLDADSRLVLVRRLVREGLLVVG